MPSIAPPKFHVSSVNHNYSTSMGVPRRKALSFTSDDLAHALFTTGRAPGDQAAYGKASVYEAIHRMSLIPAYIRRDGTGLLRRSRLATELDRSEKVALSYALGQAITTIFCTQVLGVSHLLHVDRYANQYNLIVGSGKSRADLFGPSPRGWVVAEAKGRSNGADNDLVSKLQKQKRTVKSVLGVPPWVSVGCVACFPDPKNRSMKALTWDPEEVEDEAVNIEGTLDRYFAAYYAPIVSALENSPRTAERYPGFVTTQLDGLGVTFGLRRDMYEALAGPGGRIDVAENWDGLARLALGDDFESFIEATGASADEHVPELQGGYDSGEGAEFDVRTPAPARGDAFERATAFPDATLFATNWEDAIHADDWVEA